MNSRSWTTCLETHVAFVRACGGSVGSDRASVNANDVAESMRTVDLMSLLEHVRAPATRRQSRHQTAPAPTPDDIFDLPLSAAPPAAAALKVQFLVYGFFSDWYFSE